MKKIMNKFITMLILIAALLGIMLPMTVYAKETEIYKVDESGWYSNVMTVWNGAEYNDMDFYKKIYYLEGENESKPKLGTLEGNVMVYLEAGIEYTVPYTSKANSLWKKIDVEDESEIIEEEEKEVINTNIYTPDKSGWHQNTNSDKTGTEHKSAQWYKENVYYFNKDGERKIPTIDETGTDARVYLVRGVQYYVPDDGTYDFWHTYNSDKTAADSFKTLVGRLIYGLASQLHRLVGAALGQTIIIDDLVFNNYADTNISFFDDKDEVGDNASPLIYGANGVGGLDTVINKWYSVFMQIAVIGYMIMLIYMGVRILLTSTADSKASYKKFFVDWVMGIAILLLVPYAMKYIIKINEILVETIEANKGFESVTPSPLENFDYDENLTLIEIDYEIPWGAGTDYMSQIGNAAQTTGEPALAIVFLIMTWQLITLIFHYYKRLFIIAFLIVIFPLVGFSYAIDKIADGKSQALNTWFKEFLLNVFVQTFHAIVYVFVCTTIYSASGNTSNAENFDFILIMVGVTFLFRGEEIIRQIFGQVSKAGTMKSLSDTAASFIKFKVIENGIRKVASYTIGKKSVVYKLKNGVNQYKATDARIRAFDKTATNPEEYNIGARLAHAPEAPGKDATKDEKKNFLTEISRFNAAARLNNPNSHSISELANSLNTLKSLSLSDPNNEVFRDTKLTSAQFEAMAKLDDYIQDKVSNGMSDMELSRDVTLRLGVILEGRPQEEREKITKAYIADIATNGVKISRRPIENEVRAIVEESQEIRRKVDFTTNKEKIVEYEERIGSIADDIVEEYNNQELSQTDKKKLKGFASNLVTLKCAENGVIGEKEFLAAATDLIKHKDDDEMTKSLVEEVFESDIDLFIHSVAKKIEEESAVQENKKLAEELVKYYEDDTRDGYFDDEISIHEVLKNEGDTAATDAMLDEIYRNKQEAMNEIVESWANGYIEENGIDVNEGSYDTSIKTQDGYTKEELEALKYNSLFGTIANIGNIFGSDKEKDADVYTGTAIKEYLVHEKEKRTGRKASAEEYRDALNPFVGVKDIIEKDREERDSIRRKHFLGDIDDK